MSGTPDQMRPIVDLGWANGWDSDTPQAYTACQALRGGLNPTPEQQAHRAQLIRASWGRSAETTVCPACGIKWSVDSGD